MPFVQLSASKFDEIYGVYLHVQGRARMFGAMPARRGGKVGGGVYVRVFAHTNVRACDCLATRMECVGIE